MPTRSDGGILLKRLRRAVEHLAWPPARQKEYLSELGVASLTDELALEFDDIYHVAMAQFGELGLASRARESLLAISQMLTSMSAAETESAMIWQFEGLDRAESSEEVRKLAGHLLEQLPSGFEDFSSRSPG